MTLSTDDWLGYVTLSWPVLTPTRQFNTPIHSLFHPSRLTVENSSESPDKHSDSDPVPTVIAPLLACLSFLFFLLSFWIMLLLLLLFLLLCLPFCFGLRCPLFFLALLLGFSPQPAQVLHVENIHNSCTMLQILFLAFKDSPLLGAPALELCVRQLCLMHAA